MKKAILILLLVPLIVIAAPNHQRGFEGLKWGASFEQVKAKYPHGKPVEDIAKVLILPPSPLLLGVSKVSTPDHDLWTVKKQAFGYPVEIHFWFFGYFKLECSPEKCEQSEDAPPELSDVIIYLHGGSSPVVYQQFRKLRDLFGHEYGKPDCEANCDKVCWDRGSQGDTDTIVCLYIEDEEDENDSKVEKGIKIIYSAILTRIQWRQGYI